MWVPWFWLVTGAWVLFSLGVLAGSWLTWYVVAKT
jgi:hypothetical protein